MTSRQIEGYRKRLQALIEKWHPTDHPEPDDVTKGDFQQLAREVGASTRSVCIHPQTGLPVGCPASIDELISNIHQALQTASMINTSRTVAKNYRIAEKARKSARLSLLIAFIAALAAWAAVVVNTIRTSGGNSWIMSTGAGTHTSGWIAFFAAVAAAGSFFVALRGLRYNAFVELMRDYAQKDMAWAVEKLREFWREKCNRNKDEVYAQFYAGLTSQDAKEKQKAKRLSRYRRRVSHFYQRMAELYVMGVLPGNDLYRHWRTKDLTIIPDIIIPMEDALASSYDKKPERKKSEELEHLKILYKESELGGVHLALKGLWRWLSSVFRSP